MHPPSGHPSIDLKLTSVRSSLFEDATGRLEAALEHATVSDDTLERLRLSKSVLKVSIPVRMDDGSLRTFPGYRVRYDDSRGPTKGGIRFHPNVVDEMESLAFWMMLKCAPSTCPSAAPRGGVCVNPKELSSLELERLSRGYISAIADFIGEEFDIPAPDVYTNELVMGWMIDAYGHDQTPDLASRGHRQAACARRERRTLHRDRGRRLHGDPYAAAEAARCGRQLRAVRRWERAFGGDPRLWERRRRAGVAPSRCGLARRRGRRLQYNRLHRGWARHPGYTSGKGRAREPDLGGGRSRRASARRGARSSMSTCSFRRRSRTRSPSTR